MTHQDASPSKEKTIFKIRLHHAKQNQRLSGQVWEPIKKSRFDKTVGRRLYWWQAKCVINLDGKTTSHVSGGVNWLQALLIAIDLIRRQIPSGQEHLWVTRDGIPAWLALPRFVPAAWGYEEYSLVRDYIEKIERRHEE